MRHSSSSGVVRVPTMNGRRDRRAMGNTSSATEISVVSLVWTVRRPAMVGQGE